MWDYHLVLKWMLMVLTVRGTILTSASLIRSSAESNYVPDDIKVDVYPSKDESFEGQVFTCDFHYNTASIKIKSDVPLPSASLRMLDDSISVDPSEIPSCPYKSFVLVQVYLSFVQETR